MKHIFFCLALLLPSAVVANTTDREAEHRYVKELFVELQIRSFAENREICGYLGYDRDGNLRTSDINIGTEASCGPPNFPTKFTVVAWFHTHSTYSPEYNSEYPSTQDLDFGEYWDLNGYTATPGGRLWYHDLAEDAVIELCSLECVPQDPNFRVLPRDPVRSVYTRRQLQKIEGF